MKFPGSGIRLAASASILQIPIRLIFIEQLYLPDNELSAPTQATLRAVVKAPQGSHCVAKVRMRRISGKVSDRAVGGAPRFSFVSWLRNLVQRTEYTLLIGDMAFADVTTLERKVHTAVQVLRPTCPHTQGE